MTLVIKIYVIISAILQLTHHNTSQLYNYHITVLLNKTTITSQYIPTIQLSHHSTSQLYNYTITVDLNDTNT